jgi:hypothetical protein
METNETQNQEQKNDKNYLFVGQVKSRTNQWKVEEINIGFNADHLKLLIENTNERGWVNLALRINKAGSKYMYIINPITLEDSDNNE